MRPFGGAAVDASLVDGLRSSHVVQLLGAVCGEHQQRYPCLAGFHDGGMKLGGGGAGGGDERHRGSGCLGDPEGEER